MKSPLDIWYEQSSIKAFTATNVQQKETKNMEEIFNLLRNVALSLIIFSPCFQLWFRKLRWIKVQSYIASVLNFKWITHSSAFHCNKHQTTLNRIDLLLILRLNNVAVFNDVCLLDLVIPLRDFQQYWIP